MLQFFSSHILYVIIGIAAILFFLCLRLLLRRRKQRQQQKEMSLLHRRNEALNETLRNPKIKAAGKAAGGPMEVQWDDKALEGHQVGNSTTMIELVEFSAYSRRKYLFPASKTISIGSGAENQLVLPREGVSQKHCVIFEKNGAIAARNIPGQKTLLIRGKTTALINEEGVFLNNGDHIRLGSADIQYRLFNA